MSAFLAPAVTGGRSYLAPPLAPAVIPDPPPVVVDDPNAPGYGIATIMRATITNRTAALDAAPLNLTASLL